MGVADSPLQNENVVTQERMTCTNHGASNIQHGSVVCHDTAATDTNAARQIKKRSNGAVVPGSAVIDQHGIWGILEAPDRKSLKPGFSGSVIVSDLCNARVRVPATVDLPEGTPLVVATTWDAGGGVVSYQSYLEPVLHGGATPTGIFQAANPVAILREALTAGVADAITLAAVSVVPNRHQIGWQKEITIAGVNVADKIDKLILPSFGPGVVDHVLPQLLDVGIAGTVQIDVQHCTIASAPVNTSVFTTPPVIANNTGAGSILGLGCAENGDTDDYGLGSGTLAVYAALNKRQFISHALLTLTADYTSGNGQADLTVVVFGRWY